LTRRRDKKVDLKKWIDTHGTDFVIKVRDGKPYISRKPRRDPSRKKSEPEQKQVDYFREAVEYARGVITDESKQKQYEEESRNTGKSIYHIAISDYIKRKRERTAGETMDIQSVVAEASGGNYFLKVNFAEQVPYQRLEVFIYTDGGEPVESGIAEQATTRSWWYLISDPSLSGRSFRALLKAHSPGGDVREIEWNVNS